MNRTAVWTRANLAAALALCVGNCDNIPGYYTYRAEVGYYQDGQQTWYVGTDRSYDECMSEARSRFNAFNTPDNPKRAFSWACRKMRGETFESRVR